MIQLRGKRTEIHAAPKNIEVKDLDIFEHDYSNEHNATTLEILHNADILNDTVFKFKFYNSYTHFYKLPIKQKVKRLLLYFSACETIEKAIWITDNWSLGYFHWFCDALTRLISAEDYTNGHYILLPSKYKHVLHIQQSIELLNLKVKFYDTSKRLRVKELLLPSHTAWSGHYDRQIINKLRDKFSGNFRPNKKIYISRQKAAKRIILNESEIVPVLIKYGYKIHCFEEYDLKNQIELMQDATHLIGLHGAGLTNMLFMPPNSKVLEFRIKESVYNNCYFMLASDMGHQYYYLMCESDSKMSHDANITVDIKKLKDILLTF